MVSLRRVDDVVGSVGAVLGSVSGAATCSADRAGCGRRIVAAGWASRCIWADAVLGRGSIGGPPSGAVSPVSQLPTCLSRATVTSPVAGDGPAAVPCEFAARLPVRRPMVQRAARVSRTNSDASFISQLVIGPRLYSVAVKPPRKCHESVSTSPDCRATITPARRRQLHLPVVTRSVRSWNNSMPRVGGGWCRGGHDGRAGEEADGGVVEGRAS